MRIEQLMTTPPHWCRPEDTLETAAQLLWEHDCGALPVCDGSDGSLQTVGVITDRDICMCALFQGQPLSQMRVADAMAPDVQVCRTGDSINDAEGIMRQARVRRLPVLNETGSLVGMISLADLAREAMRVHSEPKRELTEAEVNDTLAAICTPIASTRAAVQVM
jgi:CBS domain-containing protein